MKQDALANLIPEIQMKTFVVLVPLKFYFDKDTSQRVAQKSSSGFYKQILFGST